MAIKNPHEPQPELRKRHERNQRVMKERYKRLNEYKANNPAVSPDSPELKCLKKSAQEAKRKYMSSHNRLQGAYEGYEQVYAQGHGPTQQIYNPWGPGAGGGSGSGSGGLSAAAEAKDPIAQRIEAGMRAGMTSKELLKLSGVEEKEKKAREEKSTYKAFGENTGHVMGGIMSIFNPAMFGNILLIIVMVLMMWIVIQFFGMV
jgi:hypothetical protein